MVCWLNEGISFAKGEAGQGETGRGSHQTRPVGIGVFSTLASLKTRLLVLAGGLLATRALAQAAPSRDVLQAGVQL